MAKSAVALVVKSYYATLQPFSDPYYHIANRAQETDFTTDYYSNTWFQHSAMTFFLNGTTPSKI